MEPPSKIRPPPKIKAPPKAKKPLAIKKQVPRKSAFQDGQPIKVIPSVIPFKLYKLVETYASHYRMDEISHYLRKRLVVPNESDNSSQEHQKRKRMMETRDRLASYCKILNPRFIPPEDLKTDAKLEERVFLPVDQFPDVNFIGVLIGPRGATLKTIERESGAKISIRGRGAVKAGKITQHQVDIDLKQHVCIMGSSWDKIKRASKMINNIIETAIAVPEAQNLLKRQQLKELAAINGTLQNNDNDVLEKIDMTQLITGEDNRQTQCPICKGEHTAVDCPNKGNPEFASKVADQDQMLDEEYRKLMGVIGDDAEMEDVEMKPVEDDIPPWRKDEAEQATLVDDPYLAFYGGLMPQFPT